MIEIELGDMDAQRVERAIRRAHALGGYLRMSTETLDGIKRMGPPEPPHLPPWERAARLLKIGAVPVVVDDRLPARTVRLESPR